MVSDLGDVRLSDARSVAEDGDDGDADAAALVEAGEDLGGALNESEVHRRASALFGLDSPDPASSSSHALVQRAGACVAALLRRSGRRMWEDGDLRGARAHAQFAAFVASLVRKRVPGDMGESGAAAGRRVLRMAFLQDALGILEGVPGAADADAVAVAVAGARPVHRVEGVKKTWASAVAEAYVGVADAFGGKKRLDVFGDEEGGGGAQLLVEWVAKTAGVGWAAALGARLGLAGKGSPHGGWYAQLLEQVGRQVGRGGHCAGAPVREADAVALAKAMGRDAELRMVEAVEARGGYEGVDAAAKLVAALGRGGDPGFRGLLQRHQRASVLRHCERRKWFIALERCRHAGRAELKELVVRSMLEAGEFAMAERARVDLGVSHLVDAVDAEDLRREAEACEAKYLDLGCEAVVVDSAGDALAQFEAELRGVPPKGCLCGVDCEWQPDYNPQHGKHKSGKPQEIKAAIVQVAFGAHAYLLDVAALSRVAPARFAAAMRKWLGDGRIVKLAFGSIKDMYVIHASVPWGADSSAAVAIRGVLDMQGLWAKYSSLLLPLLSVEDGGGGSGVQQKKRQTIGLSSLAKIVLGKELDKRQQVSPWNRRPLSDAQVRYAANDAHCLLRIYEKLVAMHRAAMLDGVKDPLAGKHGEEAPPWLGASLLQHRKVKVNSPRA